MSKIENALERALFLIENDGLNIDESLAGFSEAEAAELRPILEMVSQVGVWAGEMEPPANKAENRERFLAEIYELGAAPDGAAPIVSQAQAAVASWFRPRFARVAAGVAAAVILSGGVAAAAGASGPNSSLYPIKRAVEMVQTALPRSDYAAAKLHLGLAQTRLDELAARDRRDSTSARLSDDFQSELEQVRELASGLSEMERREIIGDADRLDARYRELLAPPSIKTRGTEDLNNRPKPSEADGVKGDESGDQQKGETRNEGNESNGPEGDSNQGTEINPAGQEGNSSPENQTPQVSSPDEPQNVAPETNSSKDQQEEVKPPDEPPPTEADSEDTPQN